MAEEKARAPRARKATKAASGAAAETKTRKASAAKKSAPAEKASARTTPKGAPAASKRPAKPVKATGKPATKAPTRRSRVLASVPQPTPEQIAERAYLLWEAGEPGDQTAHWLRAETELRAA